MEKKWGEVKDRKEMGKEVDKVLRERDSWAMEVIQKWIKGVKEREKEEREKEREKK